MSEADFSQPAVRPSAALAGLDPEWSRLIEVVDADGILRGFHVLDTGPVDDQIGTLLCVHGNPTWSYLWRALLAKPPNRWRVTAVDQLGMGWSERLPEPRLLAQRIADLSDLTSAMELSGPVVTVAHDWGGPISLGWALSHQDQLAGVVLTNTAVHQPPGSRAPSLIRLARTPGILRAVCEWTPAFVRGTTALSRPALPAEVRRSFAAPYRTRQRRRAVADFVADIPLSDNHPSKVALDEIARGVCELEVPALLAWGPADPVFSDLYLRDMVERLPHADVHRYEGASHLVTEDAPRAIDDIREWVETLPPTLITADQVNDAVGPAGPATPEPTEVRRPMGAELARKAADPIAAGETALVELSGHGRRVSWRKLNDVVDGVAAGLYAAGVRPGERVALLIPPGADLAAAVYACWRIGAVIVVADAGFGVRGLARALRGAWPEHVIAIERGLIAVRALGVGGRRFGVGMSSRRARLLGAEATLAGTCACRARRTPAGVPSSRPRGGRAVHLGCDRTGQGGVSGMLRSRRTATPWRATTPLPTTITWLQPSRRLRCTAPSWESPLRFPTWTSPDLRVSPHLRWLMPSQPSARRWCGPRLRPCATSGTRAVTCFQHSVRRWPAFGC